MRRLDRLDAISQLCQDIRLGPQLGRDREPHLDFVRHGTGGDAELMKRDAEIVRRLCERLTEAFDCPTSYPFFRRDWLPAETDDTALLRIYRSNKQILDRSDEDVINAIVEHARRVGGA